MDPWEKDGISPSDDWASIVFCRVFADRPGEDEMVGYVFVIDRSFDEPKWKLPGGHKKKGETPLDTALRELAGETDVRAKRENVHFVNVLKKARPNEHWNVLFTADVGFSEVPWMSSNNEGNEGEEPRFFTTEQFWQLARRGEFLPEHLQRLRDARLI